MFLEGAPQANPSKKEGAAQRTKELMDIWRSVSAQQQSNLPMDHDELLQHQMSQMQDSMVGARITSMEYGQ